MPRSRSVSARLVHASPPRRGSPSRRSSPSRGRCPRGVDVHRQRERHRDHLRHSGRQHRRRLHPGPHVDQRRGSGRHTALHPDRRPAADHHERGSRHLRTRHGRLLHGHHAPGQPTATTISKSGTLPAGVTFTDNGDGTAPSPARRPKAAVFPLTITASNGVVPDAIQRFTLTVNASPDDHQRRPHHVRRRHPPDRSRSPRPPEPPRQRRSPRPARSPAGVTFIDNGDGTATLAGTPAAGSGGSYPLTLTAANGSATNSTQAFTLTVTELPSITTANADAFTVGTAGHLHRRHDPRLSDRHRADRDGTLPAG